MIITSSKKQEELTGKRQVWFLITSLFTELKKVKYHQSLDISSKIMIIMLIKDHHQIKHWKFQIQIKIRLHHVLVNI